MKNFKPLAYIFILCTLLTTSCSEEFEPIDPAIQIPVGGDDNGGNDDEGGVSTGDYWPMAINNQWVFSQNGINQQPMNITGITQVSGNSYYVYDNLFGVSTSGQQFSGLIATRKSNGVYYYRVEINIPGEGGNPSISVSPLEIIVLKDFLEVNQTWTQNLNQVTTITGVPPVTTQVQITGKILERDASLLVGTTTYENVIKAEVVQNTQGQVNTNYYWFAKDIGVIKYQNVIQGTNTTSELASYTLN
jgi:hypothetical protein